MLSFCRSRQKGHKKTRQKPRFQLVVEKKKRGRSRAKGKIKSHTPCVVSRACAQKRLSLLSFFSFLICVRAWFARGSHAVQMLFTFENAVPVKPRRLGVRRGPNAVHFLHKTDAKNGQNCFRCSENSPWRLQQAKIVRTPATEKYACDGPSGYSFSNCTP